MKILIDIGHPAHVHYYRNLANELIAKNHAVYWTVKDISIAKNLLDHYGFNYILLPSKSDSIIGKIWKQILYDFIILKICIQKNIDVAIGTSVSVAHISKVTKVVSIVFDDDDDDVQPLVTKYVNPFTDFLISPDALKGKRKRWDTIYFPGFHELAYLHPKRFTPDYAVLNELGLKHDESFFIMRFNVFKAHHDIGVSGLSLKHKLRLIDILKPFGKIFITTERNIEPELREYQLKVKPHKIHSLMSFANLFLGDSQTMSSESAVLGIPSIRCNSFAGRISYLEEEEHRYGLTFAFKPEDFESLILKLQELIGMSDIKQEWQNRRARMLNEKIDVTAFWVWLIENYKTLPTPMNDTPEFWNQFR